MDTAARVKRLDGAVAVVVVEANGGGCGRCDEPGGCRSGLFSQLFGSRVREFSVPNEIDARAGDRVSVRLAAGGLARSALTLYLIPVFAILVGAALGASIASEAHARDMAAVGGSLVGLLLGWIVVLARGPASAGALPKLVRIGDEVSKCRREEKP